MSLDVITKYCNLRKIKISIILNICLMQVISGGQLLVGEKNIFLKWQLLLKMASCGNVPSRNMNFNKRGRWFTAQNQLICWWGYSPSTRLGGVFQRWKQNPHMESGGISFQFHGSNYYLWLCFFAAIGGGYEKGFTFVTLREQYFDLGQLHIKCLGLIFANPRKIHTWQRAHKNRI